MRQFYIIKTRKNILITSDITVNACHVDDDNARTIASLASSPPVVSGVAITTATMAPSTSTSTTSSLSAGTHRGWRRRTTAPLLRRAPPRWRTTTPRQPRRREGCGVPQVVSTVEGRRPPPPPPGCRPLAPTLTVVLSSPRGPPGRIVPAPGEVERRVPPREGVVGAVVQGRPLPPLALLRLARLHPRSPSAPPIFPSTVATPPPLAPSPRRLPRVVAS